MTAVSLINPYAPQPTAGPANDGGIVAPHSTLPVNTAAATSGGGLASDQSGQGAGNGTGTGGAQLAAMLKRTRNAAPVQQPTSKSIVEAQSVSDPATMFLERQARLKIEAKAAEEARAAKQAEERAANAQADADAIPEPEYVMPNPLPTAPILQRDDT